MGTCNSIVSSARNIAKNAAEIKGVQEIEETPVVEIYIKCPSPIVSRQSLEIRQATETTDKVSSTLELEDIESVDEFLSNKSSVLSVKDCEVVLSQKEVVLEVHGLRRHCNMQEQPSTSNSNKDSQLERENNCDQECSSWDKELPGTSGMHNFSNLPPPRPSLWKDFYLKKLKSREKRADKYMEKAPRKRSKKKPKSQVEKRHSLRVLSFKKIHKSIRRKRATLNSQLPSVITHVLPVKKDVASIYDVDCNGSSINSSPSVSPASTRSPSTPSRKKSISIPSDENVEGLGTLASGKGVGARGEGVAQFERSEEIKESWEQTIWA